MRTNLKQLFAFNSRYIAYSCKTISLMRRYLFKRVLGLHVKLTRHLVAVIALHIVIQRLSVSADAASYTCGMGGEYCGHMRKLPLNIQQSHSCSPFIEVGNHPLLIRSYKVADTFNDQSCCM